MYGPNRQTTRKLPSSNTFLKAFPGPRVVMSLPLTIKATSPSVPPQARMGESIVCYGGVRNTEKLKKEMDKEYGEGRGREINKREFRERLANDKQEEGDNEEIE